jgi:chemotaxis protein methyltransferase CheR
MKVSPEELRLLSQFIQSISGISLDSSKSYLIETRLSELAVSSGCSTFLDLYYRAKADGTRTLQRKIIDAISTNETFFFRDTAPFDLLQHKIFPDLIDRRTRTVPRGVPIPIRVWSAACSTGQEVYSVAIILKELLGDTSRYNLRLIGTDISDRAVAAASRGYYNRFEIERGLPENLLKRYFTQQDGAWKICDEVRASVSFRTANLLDESTNLGRFDVILCRNVAIYFSENDRVKLFQNIARMLEPDGSLIIGSTESIMGINSSFESKRYLRSVFYQLKGTS